ncbi:UNVERIFIED_CONTAM: hypothetical protein HDU68_001240 [Siphonaria sp. JEL0065]|nr:hypothetical protein HDU68_001240 [Siphonaria sp. JEL0065]
MSITREITSRFSTLRLATEGPSTVNIILEKGNEKTTYITYEKTSGSDDDYNATVLEAALVKEDLSIRITTPTSSSFFRFNPLSILVTITVPFDLDDLLFAEHKFGQFVLRGINILRSIDLASKHGSILLETRITPSESVTIKSQHGSINLDAIETTRSIHLDSKHGKLAAKFIGDANKLQVESKHGSIEIQSLSLIQTVFVENVHGSIVVGSVVGVPESLVVKSTHGKIQVDQVSETNNVVFETTHGSIRGGSVAGGTVSFSSAHGSHNVGQISALHAVSLHAKHGSVVVNSVSSASLVVETDTGSIDVSSAVVSRDVNLSSRHGGIKGSFSRYVNLRASTDLGSINATLFPNEGFSVTLLEASRGSVASSVTGFTGQFNVSSAQGSVRVSGPDGPLKMGEKQVSGSIGEDNGQNQSSSFQARSTSGFVDACFLPGFIEQ